MSSRFTQGRSSPAGAGGLRQLPVLLGLMMMMMMMMMMSAVVAGSADDIARTSDLRPFQSVSSQLLAHLPEELQQGGQPQNQRVQENLQARPARTSRTSRTPGAPRAPGPLLPQQQELIEELQLKLRGENQTRLNQTEPDQTEPDQTEPDQTEPD
ncbi:hypothetical protein INR49_015986 [Caranx melampygus]|nr:hypothetical protein INR49_015986 [Caranx melampygus]